MIPVFTAWLVLLQLGPALTLALSLDAVVVCTVMGYTLHWMSQGAQPVPVRPTSHRARRRR